MAIPMRRMLASSQVSDWFGRKQVFIPAQNVNANVYATNDGKTTNTRVVTGQ